MPDLRWEVAWSWRNPTDKPRGCRKKEIAWTEDYVFEPPLSELLAGAGAGDEAVLVVDAVPPVEEDVSILVAPEELAEVLALSFFLDEYRSEYHPPPLSTKELRLTTLTNAPPASQPEHFSGAGSETFCKTSFSFPHFSQTYS
jgi:hypothetical protein